MSALFRSSRNKGSLGASGDLAPLSHLVLALIGEGDVYYENEQVDSRHVLNELGRKPLKLQAKEGLALINGTQAMTAQGVINYIEAEDLGYQVEWIASLTHQALNGITDAYNHNVHKVRNIQNKLMWRHVCDIGLKIHNSQHAKQNYVFKMHTVYAVFRKFMAQASKFSIM